MDDLEPIALTPDAPPSPAETTPVVRDRFLVALAVVVAIAVIALAIQLRAIASSQEDETRCMRALVGMVGQRDPETARASQARVDECLGEDAEDEADEGSASSR